jgi:hypothetical protein
MTNAKKEKKKKNEITTFLCNNAATSIKKGENLYQFFSLKNCAEDGLFPDKEPEPKLSQSRNRNRNK